jgi:hypothetical protein
MSSADSHTDPGNALVESERKPRELKKDTSLFLRSEQSFRVVLRKTVRSEKYL